MKDFLLDWGERLGLLALFAAFAVANLQSGDLGNSVILIGDAITAYFILTRRPALSISERPMDWLLALGGTLLPLLARPGGEPLLGAASAVIIAGGTLMALLAKFSLNRRFGMAPANRGVQAGWAYAVVRHPMYLGYIVAQTGYLLHNPTAQNLTVFTLAWAFQVARMSREEHHLLGDQAYRDYAGRVRHRLVPGLY
jgi:protein-S-isoprenylcysteine O-methyltransferase Ste14